MKRFIGLALLTICVGFGCGPAPSTSPAPTEPGGTPPPAPAAADQAAAPSPVAAEPSANKPFIVGVMPKLKGIPYFNATQVGAEQAGEELGVKVDFDGPVSNDVTLQAQMIENWIAKGYDAIAVAPNDPNAIAPVLAKARKRGIKVVSWDADARTDARDFFVNQCTAAGIAKTLMDVMAKATGPESKYVIITGSLTAANQNIWMDEMEKYRQSAYPQMTNLSPTPKASEEDQAMATQVAADTMKAYPDLQGLFAITSVALPGAAEAVRKAGAADKVFLTGLALPREMREYVKDGTVKQFVLWNPVDLGYLAVQAAVASAKGELQAGQASFKAGRLGEVKLEGDTIVLGEPLIFDKDNIDQFDF